MCIETIMQIIYIALIVLSLICSILTIIIKTTKNAKTKQKATTAYTIIKKIQDLIINAESFTNYSGSEKLNFVITRMKEFNLSNNLNVSEENILELVENEIALSKNVNVSRETLTTNQTNVSRETFESVM